MNRTEGSEGNKGRRERPILFSGAMVRAILEGRKTQTRRYLKHPVLNKGSYFFSGETTTDLGYPASQGKFWAGFRHDPDWALKPEPRGSACYVKCPYGAPGDRLWVKETSIIAPKRWAEPDSSCVPDADGDLRYIQYLATSSDTEAAEQYGLKKSPSIFMPRWASRITLEVVKVRVERLQDISEEDAIAEGVPPALRPPEIDELERRTGGKWMPYMTEFRGVWEDINGAASWDQNPWVWVVEFKKGE